MALNMYKKYSPNLVREWPVASGTQSGTVVIHPVSAKVGITITARGDSTKTTTLPDGSSLTQANGGVGNKPNAATVAVDGSWLLLVATAANGDTTVASGGGTPQGTPVYRITASGLYSLVSTGAVQIGVIDDGVIVGGIAPVKLGVQ